MDSQPTPGFLRALAREIVHPMPASGRRVTMFRLTSLVLLVAFVSMGELARRLASTGDAVEQAAIMKRVAAVTSDVNDELKKHGASVPEAAFGSIEAYLNWAPTITPIGTAQIDLLRADVKGMDWALVSNSNGVLLWVPVALAKRFKAHITEHPPTVALR